MKRTLTAFLSFFITTSAFAAIQDAIVQTVGVGGTGGGTMIAASALSEQSADKDIEGKMRNYISKFRCDYGSGQIVYGGATNIDVPGGNELTELYIQYATLANDLKIRKQALGIRLGIESEVIMDKASTGLYDDVGTGTTGGKFASVARAILNPGGTDALMWAQQQEQTTKQIKTGATIAIASAATSLLQNIHNQRNKQESVPELKTLEQRINQKSVPDQVCPINTHGEYPNCICSNIYEIYNPNTDKCDHCSGDMINIDGKCDCPDEKKWDTETNQCTYPKDQSQPEETQTTLLSETVVSTQIPDSTIVSNIVSSDTNEPTTISLSNTGLFEKGEATLSKEAQQELKIFAQDIVDNNRSDCAFIIEGYTDPIGNYQENYNLSGDRANAVKDFLVNNTNISKHISTIYAVAHHETDCMCKKLGGKYCDKPNNIDDVDVSCRRVEISGKCSSETESDKS